jgi:hypothetical protein
LWRIIPFPGNGSVNTFPWRKRTTIGYPWLVNGSVDALSGQHLFYGSASRLYKQYRTESEWSESSALKEEGFGWRFVVSYCKLMRLRVVVKEWSINPIQTPWLLVTTIKTWQYSASKFCKQRVFPFVLHVQHIDLCRYDTGCPFGIIAEFDSSLCLVILSVW